MFQRLELLKKRTKESVFEAKKGKTFVTPGNRSYQFDYRKEWRKYIIILMYKGIYMQVSEVDYNRIDTDILLKSIDNETNFN